MFTVLIVDDRAINREFLSTLLTYAGYRVIVAADGAEALDLARVWHPHLVISDILMPIADGVQMVRGLRADPDVAGIPVIFYTATYRTTEAREMARSCGVSVVIPKPSEPQVILQAVADAISSARKLPAHPVVIDIHGSGQRPEAYASRRWSSRARHLAEDRLVLNDTGGTTPSTRNLIESFTGVQGLAMRLCAVVELGLDLSTRRRPQQVLDLCCRAAQDIVSAKYAGIVMLENNGRRVRDLAIRGLDDTQAEAVREAFDPSTGVLRQLLGDGGSQRLSDLDGDPTQAGLPAAHPAFASFLAVPVRSSTRTLGLLYLAERVGADAFSEDDEQLALAVTWQLAPAYENLMLYEELRKYTDRLELEVAERRRTTERLRESEERYRLLWETTNDAVILLDPNDRIQHANAAAKTMFGYDPAELVGKESGMLQPAWLRTPHLRGLSRRLKAGEQTPDWRSLETTGLRRDGSEFPIELAFSRLSAGPRPVFVAYIRDITERKRAETALRDSRTLLEQSQKIGGIGSWMQTLDDNARSWWSRETYRIFGVPEGAPPSAEIFRDIVHPHDREAVARAWRDAIETRAPFSIDHRIVLADGGVRWVHERADVVVDAGGTPTRMIGVVQDITERKDQQERIGRLTRMHAMLSGINSAIVRAHEREALYAEVCRVAVEAGRFCFAWIGTIDRAVERVQPVARFGDEQSLLHVVEPQMSLRAGDSQELSLIARAVLEKRPMISNDVESDPRLRFKRELRQHGVRSLAALPLTASDDVVAVLALSAVDVGVFSDEEQKLLAELAGDISFGLQYIDNVERLEHLAYYDALTGLANSALFHDRLTQLLHGVKSDKELVAVMILDLDRFTRFNDTLGRYICDLVLKTVARRLDGAMQEPFSLARIGGDTFAIAAAGLRRGTDAAAVLRLLGVLGEPMRIESHEIRVSARAGIALFPDDGHTAATLFKNAEAALQQARASGERYLYYAPQINATVAEKLALENKLRRAVEQNHFMLHYQPKIDPQDGSVLGLEALLRWNDPEAGVVPAKNFIHILEETGLILDVGRWMFDRVLSDYRRWCEAGLQPPRIAVNVSPLQLRQPAFAGWIQDAIAAHADGARALEIELTESLIMEDIDVNIETLRRIHAAGVTIAVDDFGTGYSSLRYLAKLPVDSLKIDRSFIVTMANDRDSVTIVSTIISLAHSLGLRVVAEGVDSTEQALLLQCLGCDEMQGHLYSEALSPEQVEAVMRAGILASRR